MSGEARLAQAKKDVLFLVTEYVRTNGSSTDGPAFLTLQAEGWQVSGSQMRAPALEQLVVQAAELRDTRADTLPLRVPTDHPDYPDAKREWIDYLTGEVNASLHELLWTRL